MKLLSLLLVGLLLCGGVSAQSNYKSGYVVTAANDTLKGFIDYQEWLRSPLEIKFKAQKENRDFVVYNPGNAGAFKIDGAEEYRVFKGNISADEIYYPNLPVGLDTTVTYKTIFIEKITQGNGVVLFYHRDAIRQRFFIQDEQRPVEELIYHEHYNADKSKVIKVDKYKKQLTLIIGRYLQNNVKLIDKLDGVAYDKAELKRLVNMLNFNNGTVNTKSLAEDIGGSGFNFFAGGGVNYIKTAINGSIDLAKAPAGKSYRPVVFAGINFYPNKNTKRLTLQAEISVWNNDGQFIAPSNYSEATPAYRGSVDKWTLKQLNISVAPQVLYSFYSRTNFRMYVGAGVAANISKYDNQHVLINQQTNTTHINLEPVALKAFWLNFPLKVGAVVTDKIDVGLKYLPAINYSKFKQSSVSSSVVALNAAYLF